MSHKPLARELYQQFGISCFLNPYDDNTTLDYFKRLDMFFRFDIWKVCLRMKSIDDKYYDN